jgi:hypothetical protein
MASKVSPAQQKLIAAIGKETVELVDKKWTGKDSGTAFSTATVKACITKKWIEIEEGTVPEIYAKAHPLQIAVQKLKTPDFLALVTGNG